MAVVKPTKDQLRRIAEHYHLELTEEEMGAYRNLMEAALTSYSRLEQLAEPKLSVKYPRTPGYRPSIDENRLGAWYWKTSIKGEPEGPLSGKKIVIKDNICVAGVPMMNGSAILEGYTPDVDATVVTRVLEAGGEIIGKAVCEHLCLSAGSHTADTGPVRNPHNLEHSSGGSSSGSAVLVATGEADMAIGGDQSGSIRLPSSWCGVVGFKPTFGLVPYTGAFPIEQTLDHLGPIARTVSDAALLLHVIAGPDGLKATCPKKIIWELWTGISRGCASASSRKGWKFPNRM
jgi:amidase